MQDVIDPNTLRAAIAGNVARLRGSKGWSQTQLAEKVGTTKVHISRIENAVYIPSAQLLYSLADVFGVSPDTLRQVSEKIPAA